MDMDSEGVWLSQEQRWNPDDNGALSSKFLREMVPNQEYYTSPNNHQ